MDVLSSSSALLLLPASGKLRRRRGCGRERQKERGKGENSLYSSELEEKKELKKRIGESAHVWPAQQGPKGESLSLPLLFLFAYFTPQERRGCSGKGERATRAATVVTTSAATAQTPSCPASSRPASDCCAADWSEDSHSKTRSSSGATEVREGLTCGRHRPVVVLFGKETGKKKDIPQRPGKTTS